jgi:NAD(P)-dependent dehydrogenase (short-subunit alcohol dehydrogenase family)
MRLNEMIAVVTGGASGMGESMVYASEKKREWLILLEEKQK